jgi:hypothetical protein
MKSFRTLIGIGALAIALAGTAFIPANGQTAGSSQLWSQQKGDLVFPFTPPTATTPGTIDNMVIGSGTPKAATVTTLSATDMISSAAAAPNIASGGCGTGTNGSVAGTNQAGKVTIGATATTACTVNFSKTLPAAPNACVVFPASAGAAATGTTVAYVSAITTAHFVITGSALASTIYYYFCM